MCKKKNSPVSLNATKNLAREQTKKLKANFNASPCSKLQKKKKKKYRLTKRKNVL